MKDTTNNGFEMFPIQWKWKNFQLERKNKNETKGSTFKLNERKSNSKLIFSFVSEFIYPVCFSPQSTRTAMHSVLNSQFSDFGQYTNGPERNLNCFNQLEINDVERKRSLPFGLHFILWFE